MAKKVVSKFLLTSTFVLLAIYAITPLEDQDPEQYLLSQVTRDLTQDDLGFEDFPTFAKVLEHAKEEMRKEAEKNARIADEKANAKSDSPAETQLESSDEDKKASLKYDNLFNALQSVGDDKKLDYSLYFRPPENAFKRIVSFMAPGLVKPGVNVKEQNVKARNSLILRRLFSQSKAAVKLGLDLKGGVVATLKIKDEADVSQENLDEVVKIMNRRLNAFGNKETIIRKVGERRVEIQIPGTSSKENDDIINELQRPAVLKFTKVYRGDGPAALVDEDDNPLEMEEDGIVYVAKALESKEESKPTINYWVKKYEEAEGDIIENAFPSQDNTGGWEVSMEFTDEGGEEFARITQEIADENARTNSIGQLAIVLDGKLESAPTVKERIDGNAVISGDFTSAETRALAAILNNPLKVPLEIDEMYEVEGTLAADALASSLKACLLGAGLVVAFMSVYYFIGGFLAVISVGINVLLVIAVMAYMDATFTLPGIAALVLTVGMAVDANILIFERIREELRSGKSPSAALAGGFDKAFSTIIDANVTTLITAFILIGFGTGPVRGFGFTLSIGIVASMFCALVVSRFLLDFLVNVLGSKIMISMKQIEKSDTRTEIDFHKYRKIAFLCSWCIVIAGITSVYQNKDKILGIDFTGGTQRVLYYNPDHKISSAQIEKAAQDVSASQEIELGEIQHQYGSGEESKRLYLTTENAESNRILVNELNATYPQAELRLKAETQISGSVSAEIQNNAIKSVIFALMGILLYVALRFELGYAVGAVVATIHDVLMTVGLFVMLGATGLCSGQFTAPMLAAILMIVGYSINDTIVVFDRIREELLMNPVINLRKIIRIAINRVLSRSVLTSVTTLMAATSLWIFGAGVIKDFAFVFVIGIVTGTFSSIFIASPIFFWWHRGDRKHVEEGELLPKYEWDSSSKASR